MVTPTEAMICALFAKMLGLEKIESTDDIYALGCDSMQAVRIALEIERLFDVELPLEIIESSGEARAVSAWIDAQRSGVVNREAPA